MPASLENSAVSTGLEKASFHSNAKLRQCQRMFKLPYDCTNPTCQQCNTQNSLSKVSTVHEARTSRCSNWIQKRQRNQKSNCQHPLHHRKHKRVLEKKKKIYFCFTDYAKAFGGSQQTVENSSRDGNTTPPYLPLGKSVCRSRSNSQNLYTELIHIVVQQELTHNIVKQLYPN